MDKGMKSFFDYYGNIESWNTDKMLLPDGINAAHGAASVSFLRDLLDENALDKDYLKDSMLYLAKNEPYYEESLPRELLEKTQARKYSIPFSRVENGYAVGFIDAVAHSYARTDSGWVNESLEVVAPSQATIEVIQDVIEKHASIVDSLSIKRIEEMSREDKLVVNGKVLATKDIEDKWVNERGKRFPAGEVIRVIAHSDEPAFTYMGFDSNKYYHGNLSERIEPSIKNRARDSSAQGKAVYATGSINEAIAYANPFGFETSGKLISLQESGEIKDRKNFVFGHIYEMDPGLSTMYLADKTSASNSMLDKPSLSSMLLMCRLTGGNEIYVTRQWVDMVNSKTTYDTYALMNGLNRYFNQYDSSFNGLRKMVSGLGFDGLRVDFPSSEEVKSIESKIEQFKEVFAEEIAKGSASIKKVVKGLTDALGKIREGIPARGIDSHMILFHANELTKSHLKLLPFNEGDYMNQDEIYRPETKMDREKLLSLKSPDYDDAKRFFAERSSDLRDSGLSL